jgi:ADP-ribosylglycohydrolase
MLGAIAGDTIGSVHEWRRTKTKKFPLFVPDSDFTDDSVLTIAVARVLLDGGGYVDRFHEAVRDYPGRGYGGSFHDWALNRRRSPYNSWGNGSAMRVSPVAYAFDDLDHVVAEARASAIVTHDHAEGLRGAAATAAAIFLARTGASKARIRDQIRARFGYPLDRGLDDIRPDYAFDESCQGTVPEAITAFLESTDYEDAVRNAISLGGDADTLACITGSIAEAFYGGVPEEIATTVLERLDAGSRDVVERFQAAFPWKPPVRAADDAMPIRP